MKRVPTDLEILACIWKRHYKDFVNYTDGARSAKIYVSIDIAAVAAELGVDDDIVFGRLYYHLDKKHGYEDNDGTRVYFFTGPDRIKERHAVQFPLLASVLADLQYENLKFRTTKYLSVAALVLSFTTFCLAVVRPLALAAQQRATITAPVASTPAPASPAPRHTP